jgi:hypothetical protein
MLFEYLSYVDPGNDGGAVRLSTGTPVITGEDQASSSGSFVGANGTISWSVTSSIPNGGDTMTSVLTFSAEGGTTLGDLRFYQYLDADVLVLSDDIFFTRGSARGGDLNLYTLDATLDPTVDPSELVGLAQGGAYSSAQGLSNASFAGWAAGPFGSLRPLIEGTGLAVSPTGNNLIQDVYIDPILGRVFGPTDVSTALAWDLDPTATSAVLITTLVAVPSLSNVPPQPVPVPGTGALLAIGLTGLGFHRRRR